MKEEFQGFFEWLVCSCRISKERAHPIVSDIRYIEDILPRLSTFMMYPSLDDNSTMKDILRETYDDLSQTAKLSKKYIPSRVNKIKKRIGDVFRAVVTEYKKHNALRELPAGRIRNFQTALTYYIKFLEDMFGLFSYDELCEEGHIKPKRRNKSVLNDSERIDPVLFQKGIIRLMLKFKSIFSEGDNKMVSIPLDSFQKILEEYMTIQGHTSKDILIGKSFIIGSPSYLNYDWELVAANAIDLKCGGKPIECDRVKNLELIYNDGIIGLEVKYINPSCIEFIKIPVLSARRPEHLEIGIRVNRRIEVSLEQEILSQLRGMCARLQEMLKPVKKEMSALKSGTEKESAIWRIAERVEMSEFIKIGVEALHIVREYAKNFEIQLVAE